MQNDYMLKINTADRFWSRVSVSDADACWPWTAGTHTRGYGVIRHNGQTQCAHRVAWQLVFGLIPAGQRVIQQCGNPACCNPGHLYLGMYPVTRRKRGSVPQPAKRNEPVLLVTELRRENKRLMDENGRLQARVSELEEVIRDLERRR